jgi:hypothetical protein
MSTAATVAPALEKERVESGTTEGAADLRAELAQGLGDRLGPAVSMATTEHFNLQTARAATISEANGRASIYLAALSSNLIALAFIGQMSRLGTAFYAFSLLLLPVLAFVGVVTFQRLVQSSLEDIAYAQADRARTELVRGARPRAGTVPSRRARKTRREPAARRAAQAE